MSRDQQHEETEGRHDMPITAPAAEEIVQFGGRIPASLRRRARIAAADQDISAQDVLARALEEYLARRGY